MKDKILLRFLLNRIRSPTSLEDLKNVNNIQTPSFREAALLHGLLDTNDNIKTALKETSSYQMSYALRHLFATLLVYCKPNNPRKLLQNFENPMFDGYILIDKKSNDTIQSKVLKNISHILESMEKL